MQRDSQQRQTRTRVRERTADPPEQVHGSASYNGALVAGRRLHPIVRVGFVLAAFRLAGLTHRYLLQPDAPIGVRLRMFVPAAVAHISVIVSVTAALLLCASLFAARRVAFVAACATSVVLMIAGQADLTVSSITGAPLTPTVFRTFRGVRVVTSNEFLEPLRANWETVTGGLLLLVAIVAWMISIARKDTDRPIPAPRANLSGLLVATGVGVAVIAGMIPGSPPAPIEMAFAREWLGFDGARLHEPEPVAIEALRSLVGLPRSARWVSAEYPLVYAPTAQPRRRDPLDIVVVMVESLRAEDLPFVTGRPDSVTPALDAFAARSVVFSSYLSNAFPSAPSVVAFHASAWPHRRKEIITDFSRTDFDSLPERLGTLGYDTVYVGADPHFDNQDRWLSRWYGGVRDLVASGEQATDRRIVSRAIGEIERHDRESEKPLFAFVSTYSSHYPFRLPADSGDKERPADGDLSERYRQVLRYADTQIGTLLTALAKRPRRDRTLTIVVGDHAFYTNLRKTSGLPENDNAWTAAIINGPADLVGTPRRIADPASHVDMLPTILALVGDDRPTAAVGSNLLGPTRHAPPWAMAVRPGGLRFDRGGYSAFVDARLPNAAQVRTAFPVGARAATPDLPTPSQITAWVDDWSYLIEHNRVWNPALLGQTVTRSW
jgi:hypothetical protein